jgi:hypothetical protein
MTINEIRKAVDALIHLRDSEIKSLANTGCREQPTGWLSQIQADIQTLMQLHAVLLKEERGGQ